jgi:AcrR family transcriptional regulator
MPTSAGSKGAPLVTPSRYHHGDLRAALIARASEVVAAGGVDALSLRELARDLGVSHGAPSRHFPDKQSLLDALARSGFERLRTDLLVALECSNGLERSFTDELTAVAAAYVRFAVRNASLLAIMFAAKHDAAAPPELRAAAELTFAAPTRAIEAAQARGEVIPGEVDDIGFTILAAMHGFAALQAGGLMEPDDSGAALATTIRRLMEGLRPRG